MSDYWPAHSLLTSQRGRSSITRVIASVNQFTNLLRIFILKQNTLLHDVLFQNANIHCHFVVDTISMTPVTMSGVMVSTDFMYSRSL